MIQMSVLYSEIVEINIVVVVFVVVEEYTMSMSSQQAQFMSVNGHKTKKYFIVFDC